MTKFENSDKTIRVWIEQETLHIKAVDLNGDPVEMTEEEAAKLAEALLLLIKELD